MTLISRDMHHWLYIVPSQKCFLQYTSHEWIEIHMTVQNIAIIGAGATGLAAAWDFARAGHKVSLYEAAANVGGLAAGFKEPGWEWMLEKFYHHWFESDKDILGLLEEMGLRDQVIFPRP